MKQKHTPGPWVRHGKTICTTEGDSLIEVLSGYNADLDLATAAPDLLAALELMFEYTCAGLDRMTFDGRNIQIPAEEQEMLKQCKAAIAKAKGEL